MRRPLDAADRAIIEHLQQDGRTPYAEIAAALELDEEEVERRARALIDAGTITVVAVGDPLAMGYARQAMLGIEVDGEAQPVGKELAGMREVIYIARTEGPVDLLVEVVGASDARLLELVAAIRRIPDVRRIHTFLCREVVKETYAYGTA